MADTWKDAVTLSQRLLFLCKVHGKKVEEVDEFKSYLSLYGKDRVRQMVKEEIEREKAARGKDEG